MPKITYTRAHLNAMNVGELRTILRARGIVPKGGLSRTPRHNLMDLFDANGLIGPTFVAIPVEDRLASADYVLDQIKAEYAALHARSKAVQARRDALVTERLAAITDDQLAADDTLLRWAMREAFSHAKASDRVKKLVDPGVEWAKPYGGYDGRDEYAEHIYPMLTLTLTRSTDPAPVDLILRAWCGAFGFGRESIIFPQMDAALSQYGVWEIEYWPGTSAAELVITRYGARTVIASGTLRHVIDKCILHAAYSEGSAD